MRKHHPKAKLRRSHWAQRGWPDDEWFKPGVKAPLWLEWKRVGETVTTQQRIMHDELRAIGQKVYVVFTRDEAIQRYSTHS